MLTLKLKIHKGETTKEDLHKIIDMICEGFLTGINQPHGINWDLFVNNKGYNYIQYKLVQ